MWGGGDGNIPKYNITSIVHEIVLYKPGRIKSIIHRTKVIMIIDDRHLVSLLVESINTKPSMCV